MQTVYPMQQQAMPLDGGGYYGQVQMQPQMAQPMMMQGQPMMMQQGQPMMMQQGQPMMMQQGQPMMMQQGQPMMMQQGQPMMMQQGQPMMMQGQPMMMQGQPMMGQPVMMAGQPMVAQPMVMMMGPQYSPDPYLPLLGADMIMVDQQYDVLEAITGIEGKNKYKIYTRQGLRYFAQEESGACSRCCLGPHVGLTVYYRSIDKNGPEVMRLEKPFMCCCPVLLPICQKEATLKVNNGSTTVAHFQQPMFGGCFTPQIDIFDQAGGTKVGQLTGPCCCVGGLCESKFEVFNASGTSVAKFERAGVDSFGDAGKLLTSDADRFAINFDPNLDQKVKAHMMGAIIFLDYLYFEVTFSLIR
jgi:hypothetical protein